ncbi:MAG: universal stress protein [Rhodospirillaceae bacterium]
MYNDILLPIELGNDSSWKNALPVAVGLCKAFEATLHVMTVVPEYGSPMVAQFFPEDHEAKMRNTANAVLHGFVADNVPEGIRVQHIVGEGTIYKTIIETAETIGADLIVMASHRPELQDYLLGPNAARVVRHSGKSVLVVR